jgi:hypothetical protein
MSHSDKSAMPFLARLRGLFGRRSRALAVGVFLMGGALSGMPIRPEEIEEHMRSMSKAKIVQLLELEQEPPGDLPKGRRILRLRVEGGCGRCSVREVEREAEKVAGE